MTLIDRFMTDEFKVTRSTGGKYVKGIYTPGPTETVTISGSLQPTNARELKLPEEGNRLRQYYKFYSDNPLIPMNTKTLGTSDRVKINGETYRVMSVEAWQNFDLDYYKSIVYREPEQ